MSEDLFRDENVGSLTSLNALGFDGMNMMGCAEMSRIHSIYIAGVRCTFLLKCIQRLPNLKFLDFSRDSPVLLEAMFAGLGRLQPIFKQLREIILPPIARLQYPEIPAKSILNSISSLLDTNRQLRVACDISQHTSSRVSADMAIVTTKDLKHLHRCRHATYSVRGFVPDPLGIDDLSVNGEDQLNYHWQY